MSLKGNQVCRARHCYYAYEIKLVSRHIVLTINNHHEIHESSGDMAIKPVIQQSPLDRPVKYL